MNFEEEMRVKNEMDEMRGDVCLWWGRSKKKGRRVRGWWEKKRKEKRNMEVWYVQGWRQKKILRWANCKKKKKN
jgi:hypothetical protein